MVGTWTIDRRMIAQDRRAAPNAPTGSSPVPSWVDTIPGARAVWLELSEPTSLRLADARTPTDAGEAVAEDTRRST